MGGGFAAADSSGYAPRRPLESALHWAVREGLPLFLAQAEEHGGVPSFVLRAVQRYLACGDLSRGFVLVKCDSCDLELKVAFSCKERSVCPSCSARRAALGAAHLVDYVLPRVPWRQWTLAFPRRLRVALLKDEKLLNKVLGAFVRTVFAFQRLRARKLKLRPASSRYRLKKPAPNGATVLVLTPLQLVKRLCPLVVKPRHQRASCRPPTPGAHAARALRGWIGLDC